MRRPTILFATLTSLGLAAPAFAQGLTAAELLPEIENCTLELGGQAPEFDREADAMVITVGQAIIGAGVTSHLFYYAPHKDGERHAFGLILDAAPEVIAKALPHYASSKLANGYRRELTTFGDPDGTGDGKAKSLLVCRPQPA